MVNRGTPRVSGGSGRRRRHALHLVAKDRRPTAPHAGRPSAAGPPGSPLIVDENPVAQQQRKVARGVGRSAGRSGRWSVGSESVLGQRHPPGHFAHVDRRGAILLPRGVAGERRPVGRRDGRLRPAGALGDQLGQGLGIIDLAAAQAGPRAAGCRRTNSANSSRARRRPLLRSKPAPAAPAPSPGPACVGIAGPGLGRRRPAAERVLSAPSTIAPRHSRPTPRPFRPGPTGPCRPNGWQMPAGRRCPAACGRARAVPS